MTNYDYQHELTLGDSDARADARREHDDAMRGEASNRERVEVLAYDATPRPWYIGEIPGFEHVVYADHAGVCRCDNNPRHAFSDGGKNAADARFIVALVNAYHAGELVWREEPDHD